MIRSSLLYTAVLLVNICRVTGHGYLKSPRSRNYVAFKSVWWPLDDNAPRPESDVAGLNTGGEIARCGKVSDRNYDLPKNNKEGTLANQVQATYKEGHTIDFDVVLTAHHKGHFVYKACPIATGEVATQSCFDSHPLEFVADNLYGAVKDENYPERAYLPPSDYPGTIKDTEDVGLGSNPKYSHKYRLPPGLYGSNVLIQWHYITANLGCRHTGYDDYPWPPGFEDQYLNEQCPPLSESGGSWAEQFWNCAEVRIVAADTPFSTTTSTISSTSSASTTSSSGFSTTSTTSSSNGFSTSSSTTTSDVTNRKQAGELCTLSQECESNSCFDSQCECRRNADCNTNEICNVAGNGAEAYVFACMRISKPVGEYCILPSQFLSGSCFASQCECRMDFDCPRSERCVKVRDRFICREELLPTNSPVPSIHPSLIPSMSSEPSYQPSLSNRPNDHPSESLQPSHTPSLQPTTLNPSPQPSTDPSFVPSEHPTSTTVPSTRPSISSRPSTKPTGNGPYEATVAAYYASWQWYDRSSLAKPSNLASYFSKIDRVNFAFFQTNEDGDLWGTDSWADSQLLYGNINWNPGPSDQKYCSWDFAKQKNCNYHKYDEGLISLVHAAGAEIFPSLGGWTLSDAFVGMAASATSRKRFADQCVELIQDYGFDGIDIDWEYPGYEDHSGTPDDTVNFNLLLDDVRAALDRLGLETGRYYKLTAALPCGPQHLVNIDIPHVNSRLDELNLMTYDFGGAWSKTTSINAPIQYQGWGPQDFSVDDCVRNWIDGGGSREKINLGLSFYGRSFAGATGLNQTHSGADKGNWGMDEGTPQYYNIMAKLPSMNSVRDDLTKSQYAYFDSGGLVSFDNERSMCDKTEYAINNSLNGFLIWELSGDLMPDLSTPLLDSINSKLADPNLDCETMTTGGEGDRLVTGSTTTTSSTTSTSTCLSITMTCGPNKPCLDENYCCSPFGYCGTGSPYCGTCCQNGPCY